MSERLVSNYTVGMSAFDTLSFSRRLQEGGFTQGQAETLATEQARLIGDRLASNPDVARLELKVEVVRADLVRGIERSRELADDTARTGLADETGGSHARAG